MGAPGQANYVSSKAGLIGLTLSVAREVASRNITVNAVAPGLIATAMTEVLHRSQKQAITAQIPLGRQGTESDVANAVLFLAGNEAGLHYRPRARRERRHVDALIETSAARPSISPAASRASSDRPSRTGTRTTPATETKERTRTPDQSWTGCRSSGDGPLNLEPLRSRRLSAARRPSLPRRLAQGLAQQIFLFAILCPRHCPRQVCISSAS